MANRPLYRFKTISEYHKALGLPSPEHPLISVINLDTLGHLPAADAGPINVAFDFYSISLKRTVKGAVKFKYGQQPVDFDEGLMFFMSPGQVLGIEMEGGSRTIQSGWLLFVHPDLLWRTALAKTIRQYGYFDYSANEALFLSEKEETTILGMMQSIASEYRSNIDKFSESVIIAQLELLLTYADRFYNRQFLTRKIFSHQLLDRMEGLLGEYFAGDELVEKGLPSVQWLAGALNVSPNYLSGMLKALTGQNAQQHIHAKLIAKAKERLSTTDLSVSEIAYELGFGHPQSFSKLFKSKTSLSPLAFRHSFD
jgi:AraC family transcriptional regulator, transcriptional activator of pobA